MKKAVVKIGGSLLFDDEGIDSDYLIKLNSWIRSSLKNLDMLYIVIGGGNITRHYQEKAEEIIDHIPTEDLDWIGIHATRLNAQLLRTIFKDIAHPRIVENYNHTLENVDEKLVIGAGWKPGHSTNACAVKLAVDYDVKTIVNLSNITYMHDKDPNQHKNTEIIEEISWKDYRAMIPDEWIPGAHIPFDPVAAKEAEKHSLKVVIASGHDLENARRILQNESFKGTMIS